MSRSRDATSQCDSSTEFKTFLDFVDHHRDGLHSGATRFHSAQALLGADRTSQLEILRSLGFVGGLPLRILLVVRQNGRVSYTKIYIFLTPRRWRQYPNYSKKEPPAALKAHFDPETFEKSQKYGKEKAKFGIFKGLVSQGIDTAIIYYGAYAYLWQVAGNLIARYGYGRDYEVSRCARQWKFSSDRYDRRSSSPTCIAASY